MYTLIRKTLPISPQIQAHPIPTKINLPIYKVMVQGLDSQSIFQIHKQIFFNMLELPNCEKVSLKSFINILKAYGLYQQGESYRLETKVVAYQAKQGRHHI
jgi:hypothetical protein